MAHLRVWQALAVERKWAWEEAATRWLEAYPPYHWGEWTVVLPLLKAAEAVIEREGVEDRVLRMRVVGDLAAAYGNVGPEGVADTYLGRALDETSDWSEPSREERVLVLARGAGLDADDARLRAADEPVVLSRGLAVNSRTRNYAEHSRARVLAEFGQVDEAVACATRAFQEARSTFGKDEIETVEAALALAYVKVARDEYPEALALGRAARAVSEAIDPRNRHRLADCDEVVGVALASVAAKRRPGALVAARDAVMALERAFATRRVTLGWTSPTLTQSTYLFAGALWILDQLEHDGRKQARAIKLLDELLTTADTDSKPWHKSSTLRDQFTAQGIPGFSIPKRPDRRP